MVRVVNDEFEKILFNKPIEQKKDKPEMKFYDDQILISFLIFIYMFLGAILPIFILCKKYLTLDTYS